MHEASLQERNVSTSEHLSSATQGALGLDDELLPAPSNNEQDRRIRDEISTADAVETTPADACEVEGEASMANVKRNEFGMEVEINEEGEKGVSSDREPITETLGMAASAASDAAILASDLESEQPKENTKPITPEEEPTALTDNPNKSKFARVLRGLAMQPAAKTQGMGAWAALRSRWGSITLGGKRRDSSGNSVHSEDDALSPSSQSTSPRMSLPVMSTHRSSRKLVFTRCQAPIPMVTSDASPSSAFTSTRIIGFDKLARITSLSPPLVDGPSNLPAERIKNVAEVVKRLTSQMTQMDTEDDTKKADNCRHSGGARCWHRQTFQ
jgi:hypothetical protein